jgi:hypothetical protein
VTHSTTALPLPDWLRADVRKQSVDGVLSLPIAVNPYWWAATLDATPYAAELFETDDGCLTRVHLFQLGERAAGSVEDARRLLWATLAWGTGKKHRLNRARLRAVIRGEEELSETLRQAADVSRTSAAAAFQLMRPNGNLVKYLGPPFFTKFLYFAGGASPSHPCLILDSLVAKTLRQDCGWSGLTGRYVWSVDEYAAYCALLTRWAQELSAGGSDGVVRPDQVEYALFHRGRKS